MSLSLSVPPGSDSDLLPGPPTLSVPPGSNFTLLIFTTGDEGHMWFIPSYGPVLTGNEL